MKEKNRHYLSQVIELVIVVVLLAACTPAPATTPTPGTATAPTPAQRTDRTRFVTAEGVSFVPPAGWHFTGRYGSLPGEVQYVFRGPGPGGQHSPIDLVVRVLSDTKMDAWIKANVPESDISQRRDLEVASRPAVRFDFTTRRLHEEPLAGTHLLIQDGDRLVVFSFMTSALSSYSPYAETESVFQSVSFDLVSALIPSAVGHVTTLPVEGSQEAGLPTMIIWWGERCKPEGGALAWQDAGSGAWRTQDLPINVTVPEVAAARLARTGDDYRLALVFNPCACSSMGRCHELSLYRLQKNGWQEVWKARDAAAWRHSHASLRFISDGIEAVVLESSSWLLGDPKSSIFWEANAGPHRWFLDTWQRQGDAYVLVQSETRPSAYNTLVEFIYALKTGEDPRRWVAEPGLLEIARRLDLAALPSTQVSFADWSTGEQEGPIFLDHGGRWITFDFIVRDGQYLVAAIGSRNSLSVTLTPSRPDELLAMPPLEFAGQVRYDSTVLDELTGRRIPLTFGDPDPDDPFAPGELLAPALVQFEQSWRLLAPLSRPWLVSLYLEDWQGQPLLFSYANLIWPDQPCPTGQRGVECVARSQHYFDFPADFPSGLYTITVGLMDAANGELAPVTSPPGARNPNPYPLGQVRVISIPRTCRSSHLAAGTPSKGPRAEQTVLPLPTVTPFSSADLPIVISSIVDLHLPVGRLLWFRPDGLWLVDAETAALQRVTPAAAAAAWSPQSDRLALLAPSPGVPETASIAPFLVPTVIDMATHQSRTFLHVQLSPGSGIAWQAIGDRLYLYAISADNPRCLLRLDPTSGETQTAWCIKPGQEGRLAGDIVTLLDGSLALIALEPLRQTPRPGTGRAWKGGSASLLLLDPINGERLGEALDAYRIFDSEDWRPAASLTGLRVPLALSPDGQLLAALVGPDVDPHGTLRNRQGIYVVDLVGHKLRYSPLPDHYGWPGLCQGVWSDDSQQLAASGTESTLVYDRNTNEVRVPSETAGSVAHLMAPHFGDAAQDEILDELVVLPLAWSASSSDLLPAIGRRLLALTPLAPNRRLVQPLLVWTNPYGYSVAPAGPYAGDTVGWPTYALSDLGITVPYPPDWAVRELPGDGGVVTHRIAFVPSRYADSPMSKVPAINLTLYSEALTGTLRSWLAAHSAPNPFESEADPHVQFFGVSDTWTTMAAGLPALRFTHDVAGLTAHELLVALDSQVIGLSYVDFGPEDLGAPFLRLWQSLAVAAVPPPAGLIYRAQDGLWQVDSVGQPVRIFGRPEARLSPDGTQVLYLDQDDLWLADSVSGERRNLTQTPDRVECCAQWWPARPDMIPFGSMPKEADLGPGFGFLTTVQIDGNGHRVLGETVSYALPALSPDGRTIAFDQEGTGWLYRWGVGPEPFEPVAYGLSVQRIASPAWSPDGKRLAWVVGSYFDDRWQIGIGVFDLEARTSRLVHPYEPLGMGGWPEAPAWSPDGQRLAFRAYAQDPGEAGLWVVRADGGEERFLAAGSGPVWSLGGCRLAFNRYARDQGWTVWVAEVGTWRLRPVDLVPDAAVVDWVALEQ
ncbi:MAG: PD40 domain-containing protein [Chloroflexi bacterium]|nr:PD40 domain-containing protein [Chloroflexota bacterium]